MAYGRARRQNSHDLVLAGLRRRALHAAAGRHVPALGLHGGAVLRQPGSRRQGHGAAARNAAACRAHQPAEPREGQRQVGSRTSWPRCRPRSPRSKTENERLTGLAGAGGDKDARIAVLSKELADNKSHQQRGAGQGRSAQSAAAGAAPADGRHAGSARARPRPRTRTARHASPTSAPASTSCSPARCRSCSATAPTSSAACASCCATARTSASSATASCSSPRCCSPPGRRP